MRATRGGRRLLSVSDNCSYFTRLGRLCNIRDFISSFEIQAIVGKARALELR